MAIQTPRVFAPTGTRIRAYLGETLVADSADAALLRDSPFKLVYGFPEADIADGVLEPSDRTEQSESRGFEVFWHVLGTGRRAEDAAFAYTEDTSAYPDMRGYVFIDFGSMDRWLEEEEELIGHPRDPYTRIDVRQSSRHVRATIDGVVVADSSRPRLLLETGLPVRYYVPYEDLNRDVLIESDTTTVCPYKGRSRYWSVQAGGEVHQDLVWAYPEPLQDAALVEGCACFYHEKMTVTVDGAEQTRPPRFFSK
ncbi:MAG: DUF427 domain-containing protein [Spirochaetes bacterium]|jgi:uncharacterized protein (DUF427 family)|nr:DUF427 domain-containing protein [Spirochaetota bacterium]